MNELIEQYLDKMLIYEEQGCIDEALILCDNLLKAFPESCEYLLIEKAKLEFRNMRERDALLDFINAYGISGNKELYELVTEAYLAPNQDMLKEQYLRNINMLREYPYYRNDYDSDEPDIFALWQDEDIICFVNTTDKSLNVIHHKSFIPVEKDEKSPLLINMPWFDDAVYFKDRCYVNVPMPGKETPCYLVYDRDLWLVFAQLNDLTLLAKECKVVFLIGEVSFRNYFEEDMAHLPDFYVGDMNIGEYKNLLNEILKNKMDILYKEQAEVEKYYKENADRIISNIKNGTPSILFLTSLYTTVLKYHTRDCMQAAKRMGCKVDIMIEPDGIHRCTKFSIMKKLIENKPDILFSIDHFRYEIDIMPDEIISVTWAQDPLSAIMSQETPSKLSERDFVLNHFITWKEFAEVGYSKYSLIEAPIPADAFIYKPYYLSDEEKEKYSCDICLVCHAADVDAHIEEILKAMPKQLMESVCALYKGYQSYVYETGEPFYDKSVFYCFVNEAMKQNYNIELKHNAVEYLANDMYLWHNQRVFRQCLVDWILDAGYTNIKLWGNGWSDNPKYKAYAMGPAKNGETLSKIYQASKIVIGNNILTTAAARAWESMLSGAFYMSNYIPEEADITDIRKIVNVGEDVVMFKNRDDLIDKIGYYLNHEDERLRMAERGRKAALEKMTFDALMKRTIKEIGERLGKNDGR